MRPTSINPRENPNDLNTQEFEHRKGYFIIQNCDQIMTENNILNIEQVYDLVEFGSGGKIDLRTVIFWYASLKQGVLRIICYDACNKVVISKMYDTQRPSDYSGWFLLSKDFWDNELLEFE